MGARIWRTNVQRNWGLRDTILRRAYFLPPEWSLSVASAFSEYEHCVILGFSIFQNQQYVGSPFGYYVRSIHLVVLNISNTISAWYSRIVRTKGIAIVTAWYVLQT